MRVRVCMHLYIYIIRGCDSTIFGSFQTIQIRRADSAKLLLVHNFIYLNIQYKFQIFLLSFIIVLRFFLFFNIITSNTH